MDEWVRRERGGFFHRVHDFVAMRPAPGSGLTLHVVSFAALPPCAVLGGTNSLPSSSFKLSFQIRL